MAGKKNSTGYVVTHTHWDREWRYPIWKNRMLLVEFVDELLDTLNKNSEYNSFMMDGQCVMIEDYLKIRPEKERQICDFVSKGRIVIGPWYTLPDLYPLDGECLVRNLIKGIRCCAKYGGHMKVGYHSFGWGQTAQFPQIYKDFGIDFLVAAKRVSEQRAPDCEFLWQGPDGTQILTTRLGKEFRANLFMHAYIGVRFGMDYLSNDYVHNWGKDGLTIHNACPDKCHEDFFKIIGNGKYFEDKIKPGFEYAWSTLDKTTVPDCRLVMDGSDFTDCQPILTRMLKDANDRFKDIEFVHATLSEYAAELKKRIDIDKLTVVKGELRDGPSVDYAGNALATRNYIKVLNKKTQNLLIRRAEPVASLLSMISCEYPENFFSIAWNYLLKSHAHDSINGVTQDKTADDVVNRLEQVIEIAEVVHEKSVEELVKKIDLSSYTEKDVLLIALNPLSRPTEGVHKLCIDIPRDQQVWEFGIADAEGNVFDVQPIFRREKTSPVNDMATRPWPFYHDRHMCYVDLGALPAGGYKTFKVVSKVRHDRRVEWWEPMRKSTGRDIGPAANIMENDYLQVIVQENGSLTLKDKKSGITRSNMHYFEDSGDVGDYWVYYPPYENKTFSSLTPENVRTWCEDNGPLSATIGVEIIMNLPVAGKRPSHGYQGESCRSKETRDVMITSYLTLARGSKRLDIRTVVDNMVEDHRLRVLFPTDLEKATHSHASGHFTVDEHPIDPPRDENGEFYPESQTHPQQHFVDISDEENGLAIVNNCFTEYEVTQDKRKTIAMTLFRSVNNRIASEYRSASVYPNQKGSQCLRTMEFHYAIYPHAGDWVQGNVYAEAEIFNIRPTLYQSCAHKNGHLPQVYSMLTIEPSNLILSALKKAEDSDSYIIRVYNPAMDAISGKIRFGVDIKKVWFSNMNEERLKDINIHNNTIEISIASNKIVTLGLEI